MLNIPTVAVGLIMAGFGAWLALDSRVTKVETTVDNAKLAEIPQRLATIETLLKEDDDER